MMASKGEELVRVSPDTLFAAHSVAEVVELHKQIQYETERKREELRAMVGERYRDLIHAADTIEQMKGTTTSTLEHIGGMIAQCKNLHDTHLIGFKIEEKVNYAERNQMNVTMHGVAIQIKLVMDIPEKIWTCIENEDYLMATQLFILARHINTGLQLQAGNKSLSQIIKPLHSLIERQWMSISNFNRILEKASREKLQQVNIKEEVACSCLLSLCLLDSSRSLVDLINTFINLHSNRSLESTLQFDLSHHLKTTVKDEIRCRIVDSVKVVLKTIELVQICFVDKEGGSIVARLNELHRKDSPPLVELVNFQDDIALKLLPPVISSYRLSPSKPIQPLSKAEVSKCVTDWIGWVQGFIRERVNGLLLNITSAKTLHQIREEALKIETPHNWQEICSSLNMQNLDVWSQYFQPLLTNRVKQIIDSKWTNVLEIFKKQMSADLERVSRDDCQEQEADINWFVWKDLIGDTIIESREEVIDVMNKLMTGMWLQDRGFTPTLERMCLNIDHDLMKLLQDLEPYLYDINRQQDEHNIDVADERNYTDKEEVQVYLRDVSNRNIESILQYIKQNCLEKSNQTELQLKTTSIYTARFIQALTYLLPSLRTCYIPKHTDLSDHKRYNKPFDYSDNKPYTYSELDLKDDPGMKAWNELCGVLKDNCGLCWGKWIEVVLAKVKELTDILPKEFTVEANLDYLLVQWDTIIIEEKDDEGNPVSSTIKIPSGPSLKLQEYLYQVSRILDQVVPHTLPKEVHTSFMEKVVSITLSHYDQVIREKELEINQKCALQLLMDVRHLTLLIVPRENKEAVEKSHEICEFLRRIIDPFDYDVFYPYLQTNVKRSVQRVQTMLGSLIVNYEQVTSIIGSKPIMSGGSGDKCPALLAMASPDASSWFSLLPVTAPVPALKKPDKIRKKPPVAASPGRSAKTEITDLMTGSLPINLASAKSGAAAFFGSMTSDWFSGS